MRPGCFCALISLLVLAVCLPAFPQIKPVRIRRAALATPAPGASGEAQPVLPGALPGGALALSPQGGAASPALSLEEQRLRKFLGLSFDRRPSAMLKAWSTPPAEEKEPAEEETGPAEEETGPAEEEAGAEAESAAETKARPEANAASVSTTPAPDAAAGEAQKAAARKAAVEAAARARAVAAIDRELEALERQVTLGEWEPVATYLATFEEKDATTAYQHLLRSLGGKPGAPAGAPPDLPPGVVFGMPPEVSDSASSDGSTSTGEVNVITPADVLALADVSPRELELEDIPLLAALLRHAESTGNFLDKFFASVEAGTKRLGGKELAARRAAARLFLASGHALHAEPYLPEFAAAEKEGDHEALELLSRYYLGLDKKDKKTEHLEKAWSVTQSILAAEKVDSELRLRALEQAVDLAPKLRDELGEAWLAESFTKEAERGRRLLATIGSLASVNQQKLKRDDARRLKGLELQHTAVNALLDAAPGNAAEWRDALTLLANNWLREAELSRRLDTSGEPTLKRDRYGNFFYMELQSSRSKNTNRPRPIPSRKLMEIKPGAKWIDLVHESWKPQFTAISAQLYLKINDEAEAFPYIERLAGTHPERALELCSEFVRVWTRNHDLNSSNNRRNRYVYFYGFEQRADAIPLTRSKQDRSLEQLAEWVGRIRDLAVGDVEEDLLVDAFTKSHSNAEVFQLEALENVFGVVETLKPKTLAALVQTMRRNLSGVWSKPDVQKAQKTKRKDKDIQAEVLRGYGVAFEVTNNGLAEYADSWELQLAKASLLFDENAYRQENIELSSDFSEKRESAYEEFQKAAALYAAKVPELTEEDESTDVYDTWFYAGLGACDIGKISHEHNPDPRQPPLIRAAIDALPRDAAERHITKIASSLFSRMSGVNPAVKFNYLRGGFRLLGEERPEAREARQVYDYYKDLVKEIRLEAEIDGTDFVGHEDPFGVFVNIRHTKEIERESGGFSKYLQNQNNQQYSFNYGRPTENYRERFQETVLEVMQEHFEILSVTFHDPKVESRGDPVDGWRVTPYAYLLLEARGPQVDKIPSLEMDFDFLDTSGYAVIPIESAPVPIDAAGVTVDERPLDGLEITQILDERQAGKGHLVVEVKATGRGLIPALDQLLDVSFGEFEVSKSEDQGLAATRMDGESQENALLSERIWMLEMTPSDDLAERPTRFQFATSKVDDAKLVFQRYVDADLEEVSSVVDLEESYGQASFAWAWVLGALVLLIGAGFVFGAFKLKAAPVVVGRFLMPAEVTSFTVLALLRQIREAEAVADTEELDAAIRQVEREFFREEGSGQLDLPAIAESWLRRVA